MYYVESHSWDYDEEVLQIERVLGKNKMFNVKEKTPIRSLNPDKISWSAVIVEPRGMVHSCFI